MVSEIDTETSEHEKTAEDTPNSASAEVSVQEAVQPYLERFQQMSAEERFFASRQITFLAPDVPPVAPRPRRSELRELDDLLDREFSPNAGGPSRRDSARSDRDEQSDRSERGSRSRRRESGGRGDEGSNRGRRTAQVITEPQKIKGSTRLEAKKQRRRDGREAGRRRLVITESEFLARREAVDRAMVVRSMEDRIQIGVLEDKVLVEHYVARSSEASLIGNVYLGKVQNVLPSMEAAFVDIGRGRNAVLYSGEVDWSEFEGTNNARKIENALKPGDRVLVQVTKDPVGHKGARLTSQISLPGRFLVYVPGGAMNGISRKLPDTERARLKKILKEVLPNGAGVIVRTAAEGASEEHLTLDVDRLTKQWESIQARVEQGNAPALLHSEPDMLIKIVRDVFNEDFQKMVISGAETFETINDYLDQVAPELRERLEKYEGDRDVFDEFRVTEQIAKALDRKVWLPSGGSLVIDRTEAMTVVDVNTGKFVGSGGNLEETVTKNNLEAAEEIVRQLRLRDIGGIIVVDFIDMVLESNRDLVLRRMVECLSRDRTKHQVAEVTSLGLVQMTRKKLGLGLLESFSEACEVCAGRGVIVHHEPVQKHRSEGHPRQSKRKGGGNSGQAAQQPHAITDEAKNMLAKVAASTIHAASTPTEAAGGSPEHETPVPEGEAAPQAAAEPADKANPSAPRRVSQAKTIGVQAPPAQQTRQQAADSLELPNASTASKQRTPVPDVASLLDTVLEALPDAPEVGKSRARSRRVSRMQSNFTAPSEAREETSGTDSASHLTEE